MLKELAQKIAQAAKAEAQSAPKEARGEASYKEWFGKPGKK